MASLYVREIAGLDATFTSDLSLRAPDRATPSSIDVRGEVLRAGKRLVTTAVFLEAEGREFAYGEATFTRIPRDAKNAPHLDTLRVPDVIESHPLEVPLLDAVGARIVSPSDPAIQLDLADRHRNPEGVLQVRSSQHSSRRRRWRVRRPRRRSASHNRSSARWTFATSPPHAWDPSSAARHGSARRRIACSASSSGISGRTAVEATVPRDARTTSALVRLAGASDPGGA